MAKIVYYKFPNETLSQDAKRKLAWDNILGYLMSFDETDSRSSSEESQGLNAYIELLKAVSSDKLGIWSLEWSWMLQDSTKRQTFIQNVIQLYGTYEQDWQPIKKRGVK